MADNHYDEKLVKRPMDDEPLTEWQEQEWLKCALDKFYFFENYVYVQGEHGKTLFKPRPYQRRAIEAAQTHRFTVNLFGRQSGKALSLDTLIPTPTGYTRMRDIEVGDYVYGDDGQPVHVSFVSDVMYDRPCFEVTFSNGERIKADGDHLWTIHHPMRGPVTITTLEILDLMEEYEDMQCSIKHAKPIQGFRNDLSGNPAEVAFEGLFDTIPTEYLRASYQDRYDFLIGLCADQNSMGGGSWDSEAKYWKLSYMDASFMFMVDLLELVSSLGLPGRLYKHGVTWSIEFLSPDHRTGEEVITITDIREIESEPVRCIQVDNESHLYCVGKSFIPTHNTTTFGMDILHDMIFTPDYRVALTSYDNSAVLDFMLRIQYAYENLEWWLKPACLTYNKFSIRFDNGSSIFGQVTSPTFARGKSLNRIISDELAFVDTKISEDLMASLIPSLSGSGESSTTRFNVISTPKGTQGAFFKIWSGAIAGSNSFHPVEVKYEEIPGRTESFERAIIAEIGLEKFLQEYKNHFISSSGTLINSRFLESLPYREPVRIHGDLEIFVDSFYGRKIGLAADLSEGIGEDYSVIQLFDLDSFEQLGEYANNMVNQTQFVNHLVRIIKLLFSEGASEVYWTFEANSIGAGIARLVENITDPVFQQAYLISDFTPTGHRLGMLTTSKTKKAGCGQFKDMVEMSKLTIHSRKLLNELKTFIKKGASFEAENGCHDDRVMACVLFVNLLNELVNYEESVEEVVTELQMDTEDNEDWGIFF